MSGLGPRVLDVIEVQEKLIGIDLGNTTALSASICERPKQGKTMLVKGRQDCIVKEGSSRDGVILTVDL